MKFHTIYIFTVIYIVSNLLGSFSLAKPDPKAEATTTSILIVGDSLTEGYGVSRAAAFPAQLKELFKQNGQKLDIVNAGSSGSTSASLKKRLAWHLKKKPDFLMIALGANDGLRGIPPATTKENLKQGIETAQSKGIKVILAGMKMPMNYGEDFRKKYEIIFSELGQVENVIYIPFLLKGVAGQKSLNQADGIHPNEKGHKVIAEQLYIRLKDKIK